MPICPEHGIDFDLDAPCVACKQHETLSTDDGRLTVILKAALDWDADGLARAALAAAAERGIDTTGPAAEACRQRWSDGPHTWVAPALARGRHLSDIAGRLHLEGARLQYLARDAVGSVVLLAQGIAADVSRCAMAIRGLSVPPAATERALALPQFNSSELRADVALPKHLRVPT